MRMITKLAAYNFNNFKEFHSGNTRVAKEGGFIKMQLHGNTIARLCIESGKFEINLCGWVTRTTLERLNGVLNQNVGTLHIKGGLAYLGNYHIPSTEWVDVNNLE